MEAASAGSVGDSGSLAFPAPVSRRRRTRTIGAAAEVSQRVSSASSTAADCNDASEGNITASGFSSRCFRRRNSATAASLAASTMR